MALAGPRISDTVRAELQHSELDVMLVLDVSRSMQATDIAPTRLRRAILESIEFMSLAKHIRLGVVVYAGRPHLLVPLTTDKQALTFYLQDLDKLTLPTNGSNSKAALQLAQQELLASAGKHPQAILWISDGDIQTAAVAALTSVIKQANTQGITTYILGVGSSEGAEIPLPDGSWLTQQGQAIISAMQPALLQQLAVAGKGKFAIARSDESDWQALYQQGMRTQINDPHVPDKAQWKPLFAWFLLPAVLLLIIALFPCPCGASKNSIFTVSLTLLILSSVLLPAKSQATEQLWLTALQQGITAYENGKFPQARADFIHAVLSAKTPQERGIALHNLGNALFQTGDYANAASIYTDALRYIPQQAATQRNQQLAQSLYQILEKRRNKERLRQGGSGKGQSGDLSPPASSSSQTSNTKSLLEFSLPEMPAAERNRLLDKGMRYLRLMQAEQETNPQQQQQKLDLQQASIYYQNLEQTSPSATTALWKRLFEVEEGFPAALQQPKDIPGVQPW